MAQSFRIQEEYNKYKDWDKVNGGAGKKDLYKIANFYEQAHTYCSSMLNTFVKDDEDEVKSYPYPQVRAQGRELTQIEEKSVMPESC